MATKQSLSEGPSRLSAIREILTATGPMAVKELARRLGYSLSTIYRDVAELQAHGEVVLARGLIVPQRSVATEIPPEVRAHVNWDAKQAMCEKALELISPDMTLILDDSSSIIPLLGMLHTRVPLTVITNSHLVAQHLEGVAGIQIYLLGGLYYTWLSSCHGAMTVTALRHIEADMCLLSTVGMTARGLTNPYEYTAQTKIAMMQAAETSVVLMDHSKFGRRTMYSIAALDEIPILITDIAPPGEPSAAELAAAGVETIIATAP
ncbi:MULTISPECIES: DeoR/GlpR family DNA-binding transcription regulator [Actinotignum]|uniref:DeoR/GlpR family DNA-binding transcription regulator n=3 Tax=Bacillati TaxID=1783272 RepID=A0AAW9HCI5_9ACTO|nr:MULTISPECIES: DeoR/GlpR family DNA-binding transcription regulator [Actinotignum]MBS5748426.1 DeoR/GlpR transcriptional regulator [Actinotignum schaalii]MDE1558591.1 DeoR/GlpR family DNA-binding transcription regulator [Actinotignum schaalii]MDE1663447.1 DeoR/GlpR family DNA-binding transcription regulator [Actinotignum schaalii]MDK6372755.1 DeoR/GlpR family DNA-binding transcription regulator [Actinotignum timonense]MDK6419647.1 DeoR/GlpR family DNA-binding transcription regulator [Actinot